jgi:two-component system response regulator HupR/HoxA
VRRARPGKPAPALVPEVLAALLAYDWPGNVRELENEMRRLVVLAGDVARPEHLSSAVLERRTLRAPSASQGNAGESRPEVAGTSADIRAAVADLERRSIESALARARATRSKAAADLGISRFALQRKLDKYGLGKGRAAEETEPSEAPESAEPSDPVELTELIDPAELPEPPGASEPPEVSEHRRPAAEG